MSLPEIQIYIDKMHFSGNLNWIQGHDSPPTFLDLVFRKPLYGPLLTVLECRARGPWDEGDPSIWSTSPALLTTKILQQSTDVGENPHSSLLGSLLHTLLPCKKQHGQHAPAWTAWDARYSQGIGPCVYIKKILAVKMFFHIYDIHIRNMKFLTP